jgi:UDP-GlcNAc:undecaprenyl-phosphate/decaprenyl-phosphate GlcNAc-1-phosphate transferase
MSAVLAIHILGVIDDRKALGPYLKLVVQIAVAGFLVIGFDLRAMMFLDQHVGGAWLSCVLSIFWITMITNAFNFLDNMDGLSAGVAAICTTAFLVSTILVEQWFVAATLAGLLGATLGFLIFNFPPARIFMGDSGSLVLGFVLGVLTVRTTFLRPGDDFWTHWYVLFAPIVVLALPIYDLITVSVIRISNGKSPFQGDKNHFSHRLVNRGMSRRTAVLCLYLVTAATSIAAIILPTVHSTATACLILAQTVLVIGVIALLEQHPLPSDTSEKL